MPTWSPGVGSGGAFAMHGTMGWHGAVVRSLLKE